jgi:hypothetical protein
MTAIGVLTALGWEGSTPGPGRCFASLRASADAGRRDSHRTTRTDRLCGSSDVLGLARLSTIRADFLTFALESV